MNKNQNEQGCAKANETTSDKETKESVSCFAADSGDTKKTFWTHHFLPVFLDIMLERLNRLLIN